MIIARDAEKAFDKFNIHLKTIYKLPTANIIITGEKSEVFPLLSGLRQGYTLSPLIFNVILEILNMQTSEMLQIQFQTTAIKQKSQ